MQTFKTSKARERILSKIRFGLNKEKLPMPFPEAEKEDLKQVFHFEDVTLEEAFANAFINLGGKFVYCDNEQELLENIHSLYDSRGWTDVLCSEEALLGLFTNNKMSFIQPVDPANDKADACITGCEMLVARTGSVLFSSKQQYGRIAPVFYPVHIIIAHPGQIVRDINDGFEFVKQKYGSELPSMINLNTGPSRTADIEKTLVVGVHGPGEVFCFYVNV